VNAGWIAEPIPQDRSFFVGPAKEVAVYLF